MLAGAVYPDVCDVPEAPLPAAGWWLPEGRPADEEPAAAARHHRHHAVLSTAVCRVRPHHQHLVTKYSHTSEIQT